MCMLSVFPAGVMPLEDDIANGAELNPDGHGFAIVTRDKRLIIQKGMDAEAVIAQFMKARRDNIEGPAIFHSRIATSGLVDITGCHPFHVGQDRRTVLAHNGIMFKPKEAERSDTRIFAEDILPRMGSLDRHRSRRNIERFIGGFNKVAVLTVNPARRKNLYILNESKGVWTESGAWHSNYDYEGAWWSDEQYIGAKYAGKAGKPKVVKYGNSVFQCEICGAYDSVSLADSVCEVCSACNDCKMHILQCMCYTPASAKSADPESSAYDVGDTIRSDRGYWEKARDGGWSYTEASANGGWAMNS